MKYGIREIWAFVWHTLKEPDFILSSNVMPNLTLANSLVLLSSPVNGEGITINNLFITGPAINCYWLMNLKQNMHVKALLAIGDFQTETTTRLNDWKVTVGNNQDPLENQTILSSTSGGREVKINAWGQWVAIIRTTDTDFLELGFVAVFAKPFDCNLVNTFTVDGLPDTIWVGSNHTYVLVNSLIANCIDYVTVSLQGTTGLPAFISFNKETNNLNVTPGSSDFGTFMLDFTVKTHFDGLAPTS